MPRVPDIDAAVLHRLRQLYEQRTRINTQIRKLESAAKAMKLRIPRAPKEKRG